MGIAPKHRRLLASACALHLLAPSLVPVLGRTQRRHPTRAAASDEATAWQEAFAVELERNRLLREQLQSQGLPAPEPQAAVDDWAQGYERLAACNRLLEEQLAGARAATAALEEQLAGAEAATFEVRLPRADADTTIELVPFFGRSSAFYTLRAGPPLGLELEKVQSGGRLQGAFVVKAVMPGGSTSGEVLPGDVLQALTVTAEGDDRSGWTDVVSSFVGGLEGGSLRQALVDASFINTVDDLVDAVKGNQALGPGAELLLVFERDVRSGPAPARTLQPVDKGAGVVTDYTDGLVSPTRSTDIA